MDSAAILPGSAPSVSSVSGVLAGVLVILVVLAVIGIFVIVVVANRAEPDPRGRRPFTVYLFGVSFITLWTSAVGAITIVFSLVRLVGTYRASGPGIHPVGDAVARDTVLSGLVLLVSLVLLAIHLGRALEYSRAEGHPPGPSGRVAQTYVAAVAFIAILVLLVAVVAAAYAIFQLIAPGVFAAGGGRAGAARTLIDSLFVALVVSVILATHHRLAAPGLQVLDVWRRWRRPPSTATPPVE